MATEVKSLHTGSFVVMVSIGMATNSVTITIIYIQDPKLSFM